MLVLLVVIPQILTRRFSTDFHHERDFRQHNVDILAMSSLRQFNDRCTVLGVPAEHRFESLISNLTVVASDLREVAQEVNGPLHEGVALARLLRLVWNVYGFALTPVSTITSVLTPIARTWPNWKWLEPYAGTGYLAMQVRRTLGVSVTPWDLKSHAQKWSPVQIRDSSKSDLSNYNVLLLSYPCSQHNTCWNALERFTKSENAKLVVYAGEAPLQCCGNSDMWKHLCQYWNIRVAEKSSAGLPGHRNMLIVFSRKPVDVTVTEETSKKEKKKRSKQDKSDTEKVIRFEEDSVMESLEWCDPSRENCPSQLTGSLSDFLNFCQ